MPQRNGYRSHRGRSAIARQVIMSGAAGATNGIFPQNVMVTTFQGQVIRNAGYFGGMKKGGAAPSGTGFMVPSGRRNLIAANAQRPNFLFEFRTNPGPSPFGYGPYA